MNAKYDFTWKENDYKTPPELYQKALKYWDIDRFTIDVCCADENIPAYIYFKNGEKNGLEEEWYDFCWCNPPYNECEKWVKKAYIETTSKSDTVVAMLIPVRTETAYWHKYILNNPQVKIEWLRKGYKFLDKDGNEMGVFKNALAIVYFE